MAERQKVELVTLDAELPERLLLVCEQYETAWEKALVGGTLPHMDAYLGQATEEDRSLLQLELTRIQKNFAKRQQEQTIGGAGAIIDPMATQDGATILESSAPEATPLPSRLNTPYTSDDATVNFPGAAPPPDTGATVGFDVKAPLDPLVTVDPAQVGSDTASFSVGSIPGANKGRERGYPSIPGYDIEGELGRGGMGVVYKAKQWGLNRMVALKMVLAGVHAGDDQLTRFKLEAEAVAHFQHPNVVQIYEIGSHDGLPFFSLEYIDGGSLADKIDATPQPPNEAAQMIEVLALAMGYAHQNGIIHRDLKPVNVLLTKDSLPKITDFGLAKKLEGTSTQTRSGAIMGTPSYMAPEQARGDTHEIGTLADVYSLGAMLYELLTGRPPFLGATVLDTIEQVRLQEPVPPSQLQPTVPVDIETICLKCLQKEPAKRYQSAEELAEDLHRFLEGEPILARPVGSVERFWRWCRRNPKWAAMWAFVFVGLSGATSFSTYQAVEISREKALVEIARDEAHRNEVAAIEARKVADENRIKAEENEREAQDQAKVAGEQAGLALESIQTLIAKVQQQLDDRPGNHELKQEILKTAMDGLNKVSNRAKLATSPDTTMAVAHDRMGEIYKKLGHTEEALSQFQRALTIFQDRFKKQPQHDGSKRNLANAQRKMADMSMEIRRDMKATLDYSQRALALYEELYKHPHNDHEGKQDPRVVKEGLAEQNIRVGSVFYREGEPGRALPYFRRALELREEQLAENIRNAPGRAASIVGSTSMMSVLFFQTALTDIAIAKMNLPNNYIAVGETSFRVNDLQAARRNYAAALAIREKMCKDFPKSIRLKQELAKMLSMMGEFDNRTRNLSEAAANLARAVQIGEELTKLDPKHAEYQRELGLSLFRSGILAELQNNPTAARGFYERCRDVRVKLAALDAKNVRRKMELLGVLPHVGEHEQAAKMAEEAVATFAKGDAEMLVEIARCYAQCAIAANSDSDLRETYIERSLTALSQAVGLGFKDLVLLEAEPELEPIRSQPAFQALRARLRG